MIFWLKGGFYGKMLFVSALKERKTCDPWSVSSSGLPFESSINGATDWYKLRVLYPAKIRVVDSFLCTERVGIRVLLNKVV